MPDKLLKVTKCLVSIEISKNIKFGALLYESSDGNQVDGLPSGAVRDLQQLAGIWAGERLSMIRGMKTISLENFMFIHWPTSWLAYAFKKTISCIISSSTLISGFYIHSSQRNSHNAHLFTRFLEFRYCDILLLLDFIRNISQLTFFARMVNDNLVMWL